MSFTTLYGFVGSALVGLGLYGLIILPRTLRKILSFNLLGGGVFILFGVFARRGAVDGVGADPVPHAMVITGLIVAFAATALAVTLLLRAAELTGGDELASDPSDDKKDGAGV
ncbi:MAG: NADH-quinone oxidoreductase subunit K [Hyphomicrobiaceae bacterium]